METDDDEEEVVKTVSELLNTYTADERHLVLYKMKVQTPPAACPADERGRGGDSA